VLSHLEFTVDDVDDVDLRIKMMEHWVPLRVPISGVVFMNSEIVSCLRQHPSFPAEICPDCAVNHQPG
jgi:hypothetical protein